MGDSYAIILACIADGGVTWLALLLFESSAALDFNNCITVHGLELTHVFSTLGNPGEAAAKIGARAAKVRKIVAKNCIFGRLRWSFEYKED